MYGESIGDEEGGRCSTHVMKDVEIECLPTAIPRNKVNISELGVGKAIHVRIACMESIQYISEPESVVASVHQIVRANSIERNCWPNQSHYQET